MYSGIVFRQFGEVHRLAFSHQTYEDEGRIRQGQPNSRYKDVECSAAVLRIHSRSDWVFKELPRYVLI